jgi:hypothetical protein
VNLLDWPAACAFQSIFLDRRRLDPAACGAVEAAVRLADPRAAAVLCARTVPAILDGSNVSRYHWRGRRKGLTSSLQAILRVRDALLLESNPVLYPIVIVVDVTERGSTDAPERLRDLIEAGEILEAPSRREADALIFSLVRQGRWWECQIVTNDNRMFEAHPEMLPEQDAEWYRRVQRPFVLRPNTDEVYFPERSR